MEKMLRESEANVLGGKMSDLAADGFATDRFAENKAKANRTLRPLGFLPFHPVLLHHSFKHVSIYSNSV